MIAEVSPSTSVVLDASGNGQCALGPPSGTKWALRLATMATSTSAKQPQAKLYRGSSSGPLQLVDSTYVGSSASSGKVGGAIYYPGQLLWAVWTGGDVGAIATLQAFGQQAGRTDPLAPSPPGEGFANPIVSQLIAGTPGGARVVINATPVPAELVAAYAAGVPEHNTVPETFVEVTLYYDSGGDYVYDGLVLDAAATPVLSRVFGGVVAGVVAEGQRTLLNPGTGGQQTAFYNNEVFFEAVSALTAVIGTGLPGDAVGRFLVNANGDEYRGPGGASSTDTVFRRAAAGVMTVSRLVADLSGTPETWHGVTYNGAWTDFGGTTRALQYRKLPDGNVHLVGVAKSPNPFANKITTLPNGYRPTAEVGGVALANTGGGGLLQILGSGDVNVFLSTVNNEWWIDTIFPTD